jgi:carboxymethylproline synthase
MIHKEIREGVYIMTFMHPKPQNPFGDEMQSLLLEGLQEAENRNDVKSILLTGGIDRSFCVGGDFSEIIDMNTSFSKVSSLLGQVCAFYISILRITKPIIAAIDLYAIGLGFQMTMLTDYRIATNRAKFIMPEIKNGVACTLGGAMVEHLINRHEMMRICYDCDVLPIDYCEKVGIVNKVVSPELLLNTAFQKALDYGNYPSIPFRNTKKLNNERFIKVIQEAEQGTILAHYLTFSGSVHMPYMKNILKRE